MAPFDPKTQDFVIAGPEGNRNITLNMADLDEQRVRLARICISYGVQLGLSLMMLIVLGTLIPTHRFKKSIHMVHLWSLVVAVIRNTLLITYFPGSLSEYYVAWTQDAHALSGADYLTNTIGQAFGVVQFALIETALILQSWSLIKTWEDSCKRVVKVISVMLAVATIVCKSIWVQHHTWAIKDQVLPIPLDRIGEAATVLGAASIFYFCGIFFMNITMHLIVTRDVIQRPENGLNSLEILAIGNGILMILPSIFAGLDIAARLRGTRVLPFDAGSWVQTLVIIGLPLIGLVARYRGAPPQNPSARRMSLFVPGPFPGSKTDATTIGSPIGGSFEATAEALQLDPKRNRGRPGSIPGQDALGIDLEPGIQGRRDVMLTVERDASEELLDEASRG